MQITIDRDTFTATGRNRLGREVGTVLVNTGREVITAAASRGETGEITVGGFVGRYQTSGKAWPAHVMTHGDKLFATFGRDDRSGRFNKQRGISYEPNTYADLVDPAYWEAVQ